MARLCENCWHPSQSAVDSAYEVASAVDLQRHRSESVVPDADEEKLLCLAESSTAAMEKVAVQPAADYHRPAEDPIRHDLPSSSQPVDYAATKIVAAVAVVAVAGEAICLPQELPSVEKPAFHLRGPIAYGLWFPDQPYADVS